MTAMVAAVEFRARRIGHSQRAAYSADSHALPSTKPFRRTIISQSVPNVHALEFRSSFPLIEKMSILSENFLSAAKAAILEDIQPTPSGRFNWVALCPALPEGWNEKEMKDKADEIKSFAREMGFAIGDRQTEKKANSRWLPS